MITDNKTPYRMINDEQLHELRAREDELFMKRTKKSKEAGNELKEAPFHGGFALPESAA